MKQIWFSLSLVTFSFVLVPSPISAQITSDGTLVLPTQVKQQGNVLEITEGTTKGSNLFHSFRDFSVPQGMEAFFNNNTAITNIFSRVTGGDISQIEGLIRANGSANLFLLNPNGIIFGENASLNIGGSFLATSAESILFDDGKIFSATDTQTQPLLTISVPIGIGLPQNPGKIVNRSQNVGLQVAPGKTLTLVGGEVSLEGGNITAPGGIVNLGGLTTAGTIGLNNDGSLNFPEDVARADVFLIDGAVVDLRAGGGGSISINAKNLELREESRLIAGIKKEMGSPEALGGDIDINVTNNIALNQGSSIATVVGLEAIGNSGGIYINATDLSLTDGGRIESSTSGTGNAGKITIKASGNILANGTDRSGVVSSIESQVRKDGVGESGDISIKTTDLSLTKGGRIDASTFGTGNAGKITIEALGNILANNASGNIFADQENESGITSIVRNGGVGNSEGIYIETTNLSLAQGGRVSASTFGTGNASDIIIKASDSISVEGEDKSGFTSRISSRVGRGKVGNSGGIYIETTNLYLGEGGKVDSSTSGTGNAGAITIKASDSLFINGTSRQGKERSEIASIVRNEGVGNSGGIYINTANLSLTQGGTVSASTFGSGNAGLISIHASDFILVDGKDRFEITSRISSRVGQTGIGNSEGIKIETTDLYLSQEGTVIANAIGQGEAGNISITAKTIEATSGSQIITNTTNNFDAADITLDVTDNIHLSGDNSGIFANTEPKSAGNGGNILIRGETTTKTITVENGATIAVNSQGSGEGGNINLYTREITLDNGSITAETDSTEGGNITIEGNDILQFRNNGRITASAGRNQAPGNGGNIKIESDFILAFPTENLNEITANAFTGEGGNINITTNNILGRYSLNIDASSQFGLDGTVDVDTPQVNPTSGIIGLADVPINAEAILAQNLCKLEDEKIAKGSSFSITGRGGLTPTSTEPLDNLDKVINWSNRDDLRVSKNGVVKLRQLSTRETLAEKNRAIQQAQGWVVTSDGTVWLTKDNPQVMLQNSGIRHPDCLQSSKN